MPMHKRGLCRHAMSVCSSVCLSRLCILSKRINISSIFFTTGWPHHSGFSMPNVIAIFLRGPTNKDVECRWSRKKIAILHEYLTIGSMTAAVRTTIATVDRAVYRTDRHASLNLCLPQSAAWTTMTKRTEENRINLYAAVNLKRK